MGSISAVDAKLRRKFYVDDPDDLRVGENAGLPIEFARWWFGWRMAARVMAG